MAAAGFWDNQEKAQSMVADLRRLKQALKPLEELSSGADDIGALLELAEEDDSGETVEELEAELGLPGAAGSSRAPIPAGRASVRDSRVWRGAKSGSGARGKQARKARR